MMSQSGVVWGQGAESLEKRVAFVHLGQCQGGQAAKPSGTKQRVQLVKGAELLHVGQEDQKAGTCLDPQIGLQSQNLWFVSGSVVFQLLLAT